MTDFFSYLVQASLVFALLCFMYRRFLSTLTFHWANRFTLVLLPLVSMLLPLLELGQLVPLSRSAQVLSIVDLSSFHLGLPSPTMNDALVANPHESPGNSSSNWIFIGYLIGCMLVTARLVLTTRNIFKVKRNADKVAVKGSFVYAASVTAPLTYFTWVFIPKKQVKNLHPLILKHEMAHVRLKHTFDLLFIELYAIVFWFNPTLYFYKKTLVALHEFQADQAVLSDNVPPKDYLQLMLQTLENKHQYPTLSYFNNSIIKKRIDMITKIKSKKGKTFNYSLLVTSAIIISLAFTEQTIPEEATPYKAVLLLETTHNIPSIFPLETYNPRDITSTFGAKVRAPKVKHHIIHKGIDIRASIGTPVLATANGTAITVRSEKNWGNLIVLEHEDGYQTWYAHLNGFEISEGQTVKTGDVIGYVGSTGRSTGPHLHYEVRQGEKHLDPMDFFNK